jgi:hypothetical protein
MGIEQTEAVQTNSQEGRQKARMADRKPGRQRESQIGQREIQAGQKVS